MADFDAFESAPSGEVDPAADFLAREQADLAGLEDDNFGSASQPDASQGLGGLDPSEQTPAEPQQNLATDNGLGDFEMIGGDAPPMSSGGLDDGLFGNAGTEGDLANSELSSNGPTNVYEAISQQDTIRAEPEKIKIWREEQKARLEKKDKEEEARKQELQDIAKKELDDWYKHHQEQLDKTKENNKAAESDFVRDRDEKISGQAWEKITKLCEFNPKNSKVTKDVSRFRSILLQLKQTPLVR